MISMDVVETQNKNIVVMGVGGAGLRMINRIADEQTHTVKLVGLDTDSHELELCKAPKLLRLCKEDSGVCANPDRCWDAADEISAALDGADMLIIVCGMGGCTGTEAACAIAELAEERGIFTSAIVTHPFSFEEPSRILKAKNGMERIKAVADNVTIVSNDRALELADWDESIWDALKKADETSWQMVCFIDMALTKRGIIHLELADIQAVMRTKGTAYVTYFGIGEGEGKHKAMKAVANILNSQRHSAGIRGARHVLLYMVGDIDMYDLYDAKDYAKNYTDFAEDTDITLGVYFEPWPDRCKVWLLCTGILGAEQEGRKRNINVLKFSELRNFISKIDRLSICIEETSEYENYRYMRNVPEKYDNYYVYGIGMIESEFKIAETFEFELEGNQINNELFFAPCIEIMLSEKPKGDYSAQNRPVQEEKEKEGERLC